MRSPDGIQHTILYALQKASTDRLKNHVEVLEAELAEEKAGGSRGASGTSRGSHGRAVRKNEHDVVRASS